MCTDGDADTPTKFIAAGGFSGFDVYNSKGQKVLSVSLRARSGLPHYEFGLKEGKPILLRYTTWAQSITAYELSGHEVWTFRANSHGIDKVAPVKIDRNNTDFAISYNGGGGVELIDSSGKSLWRHDVKANAWSVTALRRSKGSPVVAANGPDSTAVVYDLQGNSLPSFNIGESNVAGGTDIDGSGNDSLLVLGETVSSGRNLSAIDTSGKTLWSTSAYFCENAFNENPIVVGNFLGSKPLIGVAAGGLVVFYSTSGEVAGRVAGGYVAVLHNPGSEDQLVVSDGRSLKCYKLEGKLAKN